ncbi:MAG: helix-turn-helix domain-containing protein [Notoacmeibacter sp.]
MSRFIVQTNADANETNPQHSIGKVAAAAGISVQTVRLWEKLGFVQAIRSDGKQRLFSEAAMRSVVERAAANRRQREQVVVSSLAETELASTGAKIKRARLENGLSQAQAAQKIGVSRSFIASVERGESGVSNQILARLADAFSMPMSKFANDSNPIGRVIRQSERPRTVIAGGVVWEELAVPGKHEFEPALLYIPSGQSSGGMVLRPGDIFAFVMQGELVFEFGDTGEVAILKTGDAMTALGGTPVSWKNEGDLTTICVWVEVISQSKKS